MSKWTYTLLNVIFFVPIILYIWGRYRKTVLENKRFILASAIFGLLIFFVIDPIATRTGAWSFDYAKTLGIHFGKSVVEELSWAILVSSITAVAVSVGAGKEERGQKFKLSRLFKIAR